MKSPTYIYALGGLEEIGKNCYVIEHEDEILVFDYGIKFANHELLGMNGMVANYSYLIENKHKIKALIITHGHEDHIGGIAHLLNKIEIPVIWAGLLPSKLIERKLKEHHDIKMPEIKNFDDDTVIKFNHFEVDFCRVSHSIPDSFLVAIKTPNGNVVSTGDFRFDFATNGDETDLAKLTSISRRDVSVLLCESTSSEVPGFSESEKYIINNLRNMIINAPGRVFISTFASNLARVEEIIAMSSELKRKVVIIGKSMEENVKTSRKIGYLDIDDEDMISAKEANEIPDQNVLVILTGSQGEENAALNTMARGENNKITLKPTDTIILSSNAIPGNFENVELLVNALYKKGVKVIENRPDCKIHASGHATRSEQQLMIRAINPTYLFPIHGEYKMLKSLLKNANDLGFRRENILITRNGHKLQLLDGVLSYTDIYVPAEPIFIDGKNTSSSSKEIVNDRNQLSTNGIANVTLIFNEDKTKLDANPVLSIKGCFFTKTSGSLLSKCSYQISEIVNEELKSGFNEESIIKKVKDFTNESILKGKKKDPIINVTIFIRDNKNEEEKINLFNNKIKEIMTNNNENNESVNNEETE